jgi:hypothetical protein
VDDDTVPVDKPSFDIGRLAAAVDHASADAKEARDAFELRFRASQEKTKWQRRFALAGPPLALIGIVSGFLAWQALQRFEDERVSRSMTSCVEDNRGRQTDITQTIQIVSAETVANLEAQGSAGVDRLLAFLEPVRPLRDCTAEGVRRYFDTDAEEGVVPIEWPPHIADFLEEHG